VTTAIIINYMVGYLYYPNISFPGDIGNIFSKLGKVWKSGHIYLFNITFL